MIRVKIIAPFDLKDIFPEDQIEIPSGTTLNRLLNHVNAPKWAYLLPVLVNGLRQKRSYHLQDGDLVVFILPLFGG